MEELEACASVALAPRLLDQFVEQWVREAAFVRAAVGVKDVMAAQTMRRYYGLGGNGQLTKRRPVRK